MDRTGRRIAGRVLVALTAIAHATRAPQTGVRGVRKRAKSANSEAKESIWRRRWVERHSECGTSGWVLRSRPCA
jgi:hypothetical protein